MIAHVVLFRPRADLPPQARNTFARALEQARREIPTIRRFHVGRRLRHGRPYEQAMLQDFPYAAVIEFEAIEGLKAYLDHPAHVDLARMWSTLSEMTLVYDYEMADASESAVVLA
jgi:hypothetical protein